MKTCFGPDHLGLKSLSRQKLFTYLKYTSACWPDVAL